MSIENSQNLWPASPAFGEALSLPQTPLSVPQTPFSPCIQQTPTEDFNSYTG